MYKLKDNLSSHLFWIHHRLKFQFIVGCRQRIGKNPNRLSHILAARGRHWRVFRLADSITNMPVSVSECINILSSDYSSFPFPAGNNIPKCRSIIRRKEGVQNGIQTRIAIRQTIGENLKDERAVFIGVEVEGFQQKDQLEREPANGEYQNHYDDHSGNSDFVFFSPAGIFLVALRSWTVCSGRAAPETD